MADNWDYDAIDLRQYINVLGAWWREIVLMAVLGAALAGGVVLALRLIEGSTYEATSDIVIARVVSEVTFDERFRTTSDGNMSATSASTNATPRRAALAALVQSGAIAEAVIAELGDQLPEELRIPANLLEAVQGEIATSTDNRRTEADLIRITASASEPALAAAIANTWARHYVEQVNAVYGQVPASVETAVQTELDNGLIAYQTAQTALEAFIAASQIAQLSRLIAEKQVIIAKLQEGKQTALTQVVDDRRNRLSLAYSERLRVDQLLAGARSLQEQLAAGGDAAASSTALAQLLLNSHLAFGGNQATGLPANLQFRLDDLASLTSDAASQRASLDALVGTLSMRISELERTIAQEMGTLGGGEGYAFPEPLNSDIFLNAASVDAPVSAAEAAPTELTVALGRLEQEVQTLTAQREAQQARQLELTQARDLAWGTFNTLSNKVAELALARTASNSEVRFGAPAIEPVDPVRGQSLALSTALGGMVGLIAGVMLAFLANYMGRAPVLRRPALAA